jgi:orotidine-5'-phosphate decarboxylase
MTSAHDPFIVALDLDERESLLKMASMLRGEVETVKVGLEAYSNAGPGIIGALRDMGFRVFADLKLHDIPNTVRGAVRSLVRQGAGMLTVHASGGRAMIEAAVQASREEASAAEVPAPVILGVTVLTSLDDLDLAQIGWRGKAGDLVLSLAELGMNAGMDGVVASAREAAALRKNLGRKPLIVTPGIREKGKDRQDQARTSTPGEALLAGADYLVVGRPVIAQPDPVSALRRLRQAADNPGNGRW